MSEKLKAIPGLGQIRKVDSPAGSARSKLDFEVISTTENGRQVIMDALKQVDRVRQHTIFFTRKGFRVAINLGDTPQSKWELQIARAIDDIYSALHRVAQESLTRQPSDTNVVSIGSNKKEPLIKRSYRK